LRALNWEAGVGMDFLFLVPVFSLFSFLFLLLFSAHTLAPAEALAAAMTMTTTNATTKGGAGREGVVQLQQQLSKGDAVFFYGQTKEQFCTHTRTYTQVAALQLHTHTHREKMYTHTRRQLNSRLFQSNREY